jgi:hypothetical protein
MRLLRTFTATDAVEGAVEVRLELSDSLKDYRTRVRVLLITLVLGVLLSISAAFMQIGAFIDHIIAIIDGQGEVDLAIIVVGLVFALLSTLVLAMGMADVIFSWQVRRYFALLRARYGTLEAAGMGTSPRPVPIPGRSGEHPEAEAMRDPARTLLGMAREAESEVPQVDNLLRYCIVFTFMLTVLMLVSGAISLTRFTVLPEDVRSWVSALHLSAMVVLAVSIALLIEAQRFSGHFVYRVQALEAFEAQGPVPVPPGGSSMDRLAKCLTAKGIPEDMERGSSELEGASGETHDFDMVMGEPGDRILVRAYDRVPVIEDLRDLRTAAVDVARKDGVLPVRIIALVGVDIDDLDVDDIVYDYLMDHPILDELGERARSLQIVAEVEGYYSVLPFTAP